MSDIAVSVDQVSKRYEIGSLKRRHDTLRDQVSDAARSLFQRHGKGAGESRQIWALKDVSFDIKHGEVVGIIGRNGSGKSTLLKILSRITGPTQGHVDLYGRVGSLLEVGTGFHPELTGRENVYLNGSILGMKRAEIARKFDEIVAFAEIDQFLDTPVKRYSSGMYVRLAFAVAAHLEPEILIVDEVLAVGDVAFQRKCLGKMEGVAKEGRTVLFVSHNMTAVEYLCRKAIVLQNGSLLFTGSSKEAISHYCHNIFGDGDEPEIHSFDLTKAPGRPNTYRPSLQRLELVNAEGQPLKGSLPVGAPLTARIHFQLDQPALSLGAGLGFDNLFGQRVFSANSVFQPDQPTVRSAGPQVFVCNIPSFTLVPGEYTMKVGLDINNATADVVENAGRLTVSEADYYGGGRNGWKGFFLLRHHWHLEY